MRSLLVLCAMFCLTIALPGCDSGGGGDTAGDETGGDTGSGTDGGDTGGAETGSGTGIGIGDTIGGGGGGASRVLGQVSCVTIQPGEVRAGQPTIGSVAVAFSAHSCDGVGVVDLTSEDFTLTEDGEAISATEAQASILDRDAEAFITLVLDNSPSVTSAGALDDAVDAALGFVDKVVGDGLGTTYVRVAFFSKFFEVKLDFSNDLTAVKAAVETLRHDTTGSNTTNLYGAMIDALEGSAAAQSERRSSMRGGVLLLGQVVVFTDGSDQAALHTLEQALDAIQGSSDDVVTLAFGGEVDGEVLKQLGPDGSYVSTNASGLAGVFGDAADQLVSRKAAHYVLAYCTPKLAGTHELVLALGDKGSSSGISFSAEGFAAAGPECSVSALAAACDGKSCGGLWCEVLPSVVDGRLSIRRPTPRLRGWHRGLARRSRRPGTGHRLGQAARGERR